MDGIRTMRANLIEVAVATIILTLGVLLVDHGPTRRASNSSTFGATATLAAQAEAIRAQRELPIPPAIPAVSRAISQAGLSVTVSQRGERASGAVRLVQYDINVRDGKTPGLKLTLNALRSKGLSETAKVGL